jgi:hypothetical protein
MIKDSSFSVQYKCQNGDSAVVKNFDSRSYIPFKIKCDKCDSWMDRIYIKQEMKIIDENSGIS